MNHNKLSLITLFAALGSACTTGAPEGGEAVAGFNQAISADCNTHSGLMPTKASLAVAMANELKRWEPLTDLTRVWMNGVEVVQLSSAGLNRCSAVGSSCANTKALLNLQDGSVSQIVDQTTFNPTNYRQDLLASFQRQIDRNNDLLRNDPGAIPGPHSLDKVGGPTNLGTGACGPHWLFNPKSASSGGYSTATVAHGAAYELRGIHSGLCVDVAGASTADGANVRLWACNGGTQQQFRFESVGSGYFQIRNVRSNKCLDVYGHSTANGANIVQWTCLGNPNQQFSVPDVRSGGVVRIVSRLSGQALDAYSFGTSNGTNIVQWPVTGADNQHFAMEYPNPQDLANNLYFFGHPNNAYLAFTVTNGNVAIDPIDGDNSAPTTTSGSCPTFELDRVYSPSKNLGYYCCVTVAGANGALAAVPKAYGYYGCKAGLIPKYYF